MLLVFIDVNVLFTDSFLVNMSCWLYVFSFTVLSSERVGNQLCPFKCFFFMNFIGANVFNLLGNFHCHVYSYLIQWIN